MGKFITIKKRNLKKTVSEAAYRNYFKDFGWEKAEEDNSSVAPVEDTVEAVEDTVEAPVEENNVEAEVEAEDETPDEVWDEAEAEEDVEKPLSEMTREELEAKAAQLGVEVGEKSTAQLRKAIKEKM